MSVVFISHLFKNLPHFAGEGWYVYIEASSPRLKGDIARFSSAQIDKAGIPTCIDFWFHMYGDAVDTLNVYTRANGNLGNPVWTRTGERGTDWVRGQVEVIVDNNFQVSISVFSKVLT